MKRMIPLAVLAPGGSLGRASGRVDEGGAVG